MSNDSYSNELGRVERHEHKRQALKQAIQEKFIEVAEFLPIENTKIYAYVEHENEYEDLDQNTDLDNAIDNMLSSSYCDVDWLVFSTDGFYKIDEFEVTYEKYIINDLDAEHPIFVIFGYDSQEPNDQE